VSKKAIAALSTVIDPELRRPITDLGMVGSVTVAGEKVMAEIKLTIVGCPAAQKIERDVREALSSEFTEVEVSMTTMNQQERDELKQKLRGSKPIRHNPFAAEDNLTRIIFVGSGKGGVGKSTITANLAIALARKGLNVGLIDADIFGYSSPQIMGISQGPTKVDELMLPPIAHDVRVMSIGFFVDNNQPVGWRGPMLHRAIEQFLTDVYWGDLDFLLVDLPPGTGDVAISLGQLLPKALSLVVTTPQQTAATVAERSGAIGLQTGQSVLGVVENLSYLATPQGRQEIFGAGGGEAVAKRLSELSGEDVQLLAQLPLSELLRAASDAGQPLDAATLDSELAGFASLVETISKIRPGIAGKKLGLKAI
jgi:ATP-binding protein involved in chromosome partitioning